MLIRSALCVVVLVSCSSIDNTVDDAGYYHGPDGAIEFGPGTACVGWDASAALTPQPACTPSMSGSPNPACTSWSQTIVPPMFPIGDEAYCEHVDGTIQCIVTPGTLPPCQPGTSGDAFCVAWVSQFATSGTPVAHCEPGCSSNCAGNQPPNSQCEIIGCAGNMIMLNKGTGPQCEPPCQ